jgi:hypothetical protein
MPLLNWKRRCRAGRSIGLCGGGECRLPEAPGVSLVSPIQRRTKPYQQEEAELTGRAGKHSVRGSGGKGQQQM